MFATQVGLDRHLQQKDDDGHRRHRNRHLPQRHQPPEDVYIPLPSLNNQARSTRQSTNRAEEEANRRQFDGMSEMQSPDRTSQGGSIAPELESPQPSTASSPSALQNLVRQNMALQEWPYLDVDDSDNEQYFLPPADQLGSEEEEELEELSAFQDEQQLAIPSVVTGQGLPFSQEEFDANHPPPVLDGHVQMALRIYDLLEHVNAPIYTFDAIIKILQESSPQCLSSIQQFPKR